MGAVGGEISGRLPLELDACTHLGGVGGAAGENPERPYGVLVTGTAPTQLADAQYSGTMGKCPAVLPDLPAAASSASHTWGPLSQPSPRNGVPRCSPRAGLGSPQAPPALPGPR